MALVQEGLETKEFVKKHPHFYSCNLNDMSIMYHIDYINSSEATFFIVTGCNYNLFIYLRLVDLR